MHIWLFLAIARLFQRRRPRHPLHASLTRIFFVMIAVFLISKLLGSWGDVLSLQGWSENSPGTSTTPHSDPWRK